MQEPFELIAEGDGKINLRWFAKGNLRGFNILRKEGKEVKDQEFRRINMLPIPFFASQGGDKGLIYTFKDAGTGKDKLYTYKIETILPDGISKESKSLEVYTNK